MTIIDSLRSAGIAMGTRYAATSLPPLDGTNASRSGQLYVGYTTDETKKLRAEELGAYATLCGGSFPSWEIRTTVVVGA